ncbi:MAG TPA: PQQ-binding-like beta-propeller repeat protein [Pirellulales bacterium]|nr:PQQ-binding-like beta-propeller repeat protein [Pirellulales bacterium]
MPRIFIYLIACSLMACAFPSVCQAEANWPRWRGPQENGHSSETDLPVKWDAHSITYKVPLPGRGQSTPVIWGERMFLTTALDEGRQRQVLCLDRNDGKILWQQTAWTGEPEKSHVMNGWASASCVTDGQIVVAFFGIGGLHAYSVEGKPLWSRELGSFVGPWGVAACPVIVGDRVIQNGDSDENAFLIALDKRTGETVWKTPRPDHRGWSTPILIKAAGRRELVLNGHDAVRGYDPETGKELWSCRSFNGRGEPTVTPAGDLLCCVNGLSGDIYAVRPGGNGDVTESRMAWHTPRKGKRDIPSPIVVGNYITVVDMKGIATCYDAKSGRELWKDRIGENFSSSPIAANGLAYFQSEDGLTIVLRPGPKPDVVERNPLSESSEELFRASLVPSEGQIFSRSDRMLYCIGQRRKSGS